MRELQRLVPSASIDAPRPSGELETAVELRRDAVRAEGLSCYRDGVLVWTAQEHEAALPYTLWTVYSGAVEQLGGRYLFLHAGAVARGGCGVLLPAASGSGKSTLVAGLTAAGFRYLTDDIAPLELGGLGLRPFPKRLNIKAGGRRALLSLYPELGLDAPRFCLPDGPVWLLAQPEEAPLQDAVPVRYIVVPRYECGAATTLEPIPRSVALRHLLEQTFNARAQGSRGVEAIVGMLREAECYELTVGDLREAVDRVIKIVSP